MAHFGKIESECIVLMGKYSRYMSKQGDTDDISNIVLLVMKINQHWNITIDFNGLHIWTLSFLQTVPVGQFCVCSLYYNGIADLNLTKKW